MRTKINKWPQSRRGSGVTALHGTGIGIQSCQFRQPYPKAPVPGRATVFFGMRPLCTSLVFAHVQGNAQAGEWKGLRGGAPPPSEGC